MKANCYLSVIVPVYNEVKRLKNIYKISDFLKKLPYKTELIFVDDGSSDNTLNILRKTAKKLNFKVLSYKQNKGKGYAVKAGMLKAQGKYRLFTDIDLSVPIEEMSRFMEFMQKNSVVIGSRRKAGSRILKHQSKMRELMGHFFTWLSQKSLGLKVSDFTCGFKCFEKEAAKNIFQRAIINRWSFDSEILFIAEKLCYKIYEAPVKWFHNPDTKVKFPQDIIRSFFELFTIRINEVRGLYK